MHLYLIQINIISEFLIFEPKEPVSGNSHSLSEILQRVRTTILTRRVGTFKLMFKARFGPEADLVTKGGKPKLRICIQTAALSQCDSTKKGSVGRFKQLSDKG
jgi:hypothetical protein